MLLLLLLASLAVSADAECAGNCQPCERNVDCCNERAKNGGGPVCGCVHNPIQGGPPKVCRCNDFNLNECVVANVARAKAAKAAELAAKGQTLEEGPLPKCVTVPKGFVRKVPCEEDVPEPAKAQPAPSSNTTAAAGAAAPNTSSGVAGQIPLK